MIDERIVKFISHHHVLTLATTSEQNEVWVSNAFYAYDKERNLLIFTSDDKTLHTQQMAANPTVAVSIVLETRIVGRVQGCQMRGIAHRADNEARKRYIKRFPYAAAADLQLWSIGPTYIKFTDNTLGFGKKLIWQRDIAINEA